MSTHDFRIVVAEDGHSATLTTETEHGHYEQTLYWPDEIVTEAIVRERVSDMPMIDDMQVGEGANVKRHRRKRGTLWVHHYWGPPTWWLPRFVPMKWGCRGGWFRQAFVIQWSTRLRDREGS